MKDEIMSLDKDEQKAIFKQAIKEWLDEVFAEFGKYTLKGILALTLCGVIYFGMLASGWHR